VKRGDVFWADLAPRSGSEQSGRRPVIVVSHDSFNQAATWRSVIVVPVSTSQRQGRQGLTAIALPAGSAALARDSLAICHQVTTVDKSKLSRFIGALPTSALREVEEGLRVAMDLE
jgi:mRNA interferase MazF